MRDVKNLRRGDVVMAIQHLDHPGADVRAGTIGVVFEEANAYKDGGGPMVRWMNMGACNIHHGDAVRMRGGDRLEITDAATGEIVGNI
jgi:hypothetical protein